MAPAIEPARAARQLELLPELSRRGGVGSLPSRALFARALAPRRKRASRAPRGRASRGHDGDFAARRELYCGAQGSVATRSRHSEARAERSRRRPNATRRRGSVAGRLPGDLAGFAVDVDGRPRGRRSITHGPITEQLVARARLVGRVPFGRLIGRLGGRRDGPKPRRGRTAGGTAEGGVRNSRPTRSRGVGKHELQEPEKLPRSRRPTQAELGCTAPNVPELRRSFREQVDRQSRVQEMSRTRGVALSGRGGGLRAENLSPPPTSGEMGIAGGAANEIDSNRELGYFNSVLESGARH